MKNKVKEKMQKIRNYVVTKMIKRSQKAGLHTDKKKEVEKNKCRKKVDIKNIEDQESIYYVEDDYCEETI